MSGTLEAGDLKKFRPVWRDTLALKFGLNEINFVQPPAYGGVTAAQVFQILNNNRLFKQAKMNLTHLLGSFDDNGIQVSQATRGGVSWGYHTDVTIQLGYTTEILASMAKKLSS